MKIGVTGLFGYGNPGDELILQNFLNLHEKDQITIFPPNETHKIPESEIQVLYFPGGGIFYDVWIQNYFPKQLIKKINIPIIFLATGISHPDRGGRGNRQVQGPPQGGREQDRLHRAEPHPRERRAGGDPPPDLDPRAPGPQGGALQAPARDPARARALHRGGRALAPADPGRGGAVEARAAPRPGGGARDPGLRARPRRGRAAHRADRGGEGRRAVQVRRRARRSR